MTTITDKLEKILQVMAAKGTPIDAYLQPGLSRQEIDAQTAHLPFRLPEELYELYQWRNGSPTDGTFSLFLFRDTLFLPLAEGLEDYRMMNKYYIPALGGVDVGVDLTACFPFAGYEGNNYALCAGKQTLVPGHERPVISVFEGVEAHFISFPRMLDTMIAWFESGVHRVNDASVDEKAEQETWNKYNPGLFPTG